MTARLRRRPDRKSASRKGSSILSEAFAGSVRDAAALGFVVSQVPQATAPVLWVQDRVSRLESGRVCLAGLGVGRPVICLLYTSDAADD